MKFIRKRNIDSNFSNERLIHGGITGSIFGSLAGLSLLNEKEKMDKKKVLRNLLIGAGLGGLSLAGLEHFLLDRKNSADIVAESIKK